jgi:hypothetical protein
MCSTTAHNPSFDFESHITTYGIKRRNDDEATAGFHFIKTLFVLAVGT